jgi:cellobiose transport system permease protein
VLTVILLGSAFPFYWSIVAASRTNAEMVTTPPPLIPGPNLLSNMREALNQVDMVKAIINTVIVAGSITVGTVMFCTLAGFAFAKLRFTGRNVLLGIVIATLLIPTQLGVIPLFMLMAKIHWIDHLQAVIVPALVSAFGVFFMRQYLLEAVPDELVEAATVDGATRLRTFWSVVMPLARPGMAVLGMLTFVTAWNDLFWPLVALSPKNPTVQVALTGLGRGYATDNSIIMAGTLLGMLPLLIVFLVLGRQIVGGIMQGAVKG